MQLLENTLLSGGRFRIIRCLGQGGFGITYLAEDNMLGVNVAIKEFFIGQYCNRDARTGFVSVGVESMRGAINDYYDKFIKEAGKIRTLNHPNIVRVYDVFKENGTAYYIMDFHSNGSLSDLVKKQGAMSEKVALRYIRQVASALKYIHSRNMMHLDVKPDNILLDSEGNAILIDFGISKHYDKEGKATTLTPGGYTPGYAAGSQMAGSKVNSFSPTLDIYSLGATLYNLLTGEEPPLVSEIYDYGFPSLPKEVSAATRATIERSMSPKSLDRPQSIDEFLGLLPDITDDKEPERLKQPKRPFNWKKFAGVVVAIFCVVFAGFGVKECNDYRAEQAREKARLAAIEQARIAAERRLNDSVAAAKRYNDSIAVVKRYNDSVAAVKRYNDLITKQFSGLRIACVKNSDGSLHYFTAVEWEANKAKSSYNKLGVLLQANGREFIIAAKDCADYSGDEVFVFGAYGVDISGVRDYKDKNKLDDIWTGKEDTRAIINQTKGKKDNDGIVGAPAAEAAWSYKACSNDPLQWYLPSISELRLIYNNKTKINNLLDKYFGGGSIADDWYWSSSSYDKDESWLVNIDYGNNYYYSNRISSNRVRAVASAK